MLEGMTLILWLKAIKRLKNKEITSEKIKNWKKEMSPLYHIIYYANLSKASVLTHYLRPEKTIDFNNLKQIFLHNDIKKTNFSIINKLNSASIRTFFLDLKEQVNIDTKKEIVKCISPDLVSLTFGEDNLRLKHKRLKISYSNELISNYPHPFQ